MIDLFLLIYSPVIVCICNQKESINYDTYFLLFETKEVQLFLSFSYTGYYKSIINYFKLKNRFVY